MECTKTRVGLRRSLHSMQADRFWCLGLAFLPSPATGLLDWAATAPLAVPQLPPATCCSATPTVRYSLSKALTPAGHLATSTTRMPPRKRVKPGSAAAASRHNEPAVLGPTPRCAVPRYNGPAGASPSRTISMHRAGSAAAAAAAAGGRPQLSAAAALGAAAGPSLNCSASSKSCRRDSIS